MHACRCGSLEAALALLEFLTEENVAAKNCLVSSQPASRVCRVDNVIHFTTIRCTQGETALELWEGSAADRDQLVVAMEALFDTMK